MLTLKLINEETDRVIRGLEKKHFQGAAEAIAAVQATDKRRREAQQQLDNLLAESKKKAAEIGALMKQGLREQADQAKAAVATLKEKAKDLEAVMDEAQRQLTEQLSLKLTSKTTLYTSEYADYLSGGEISRAAFGGWDNGVALNYAITDNLSIGAHLNFLYKLDHSVRHCPGWDSYSVGGDHSTHAGLLYGGVSVCFAF